MTMAAIGLDRSQYVLPNDTGICVLECKGAFEELTNREKLYAHYLSQGSWYGSLACLIQCSPESPGIFVLLQKLFRAQTPETLRTVALGLKFTEEEFDAFLIFAAAFYANLGNYKAFGYTKFVPNLPEEKFEMLVKGSAAYSADPTGVQAVWDRLKGPLFSLEKRLLQVGIGDSGITPYFSGNCTLKDAEVAQEFLNDKKLSGYNTRLFKTFVDGKKLYEVRLASSKTDGEDTAEDADMAVLGTHTFTPVGETDEITFNVTRGDYSSLMKHLADNLALAKKHVANEDERQMLDAYIRSFTEGSISAHKVGSTHWIHNKGPIIESYIGFIESYRDPFGVRGEFEGFVAMVNKPMSAKFGELVEKAEHFLPLLPWPTAYEKDRFMLPDFTSLDVLSFAGSHIPAGINIPNYYDIRQEHGFKNVSLGNVLSSGYKDTKITFLDDCDKELFAKLKGPSFEVQVGLHELLGHGSGKLFIKKADGTYNFDIENVKHAETGEKITSWYSEDETWDGKFAALSSSYEECRAECVGIYLCLSSEVLRIFGHNGQVADDIIYINWLNMVRAGFLGLEFYTPESQTWRQAHMQARYVILRVLLEAGEGLVSVDKITGDDGKPDLLIHLDRTKINTVGKKAIGDFLRKLQVYKATGDYPAGKAIYEKYSAVNDIDPPHFQSLRPIILARKEPRKLFVQSNTQIEGDTVKLVEYESTPAGLISSFIDRFPDAHIDTVIHKLWDKDVPHFS